MALQGGQGIQKFQGLAVCYRAGGGGEQTERGVDPKCGASITGASISAPWRRVSFFRAVSVPSADHGVSPPRGLVATHDHAGRDTR